MHITATHIAKICAGTWYQDRLPKTALTALSIDSRAMHQNALFIALQGANHDGHAFISHLDPEAGHACIVERPQSACPVPQLVVASSLAALQSLARHRAHTTAARKIAITGSVGKTGTKDMLAQILSVYGRTHASAGNFNNHIGVPLTVCAMPADTEFLVAEIGMNHAGEIAQLSDIVAPDIAIITKIADAHLEHFTDIAEIAEAKAEIFSSLNKTICGGGPGRSHGEGGIAILPRDDVFYARLAGAARLLGDVKQIISFGTHSDATIRLISIDSGEPDAEGFLVHVQISSLRGNSPRQISFTLGTHARHWVTSALITLAVCAAMGLDIETALPHFARSQVPTGRGRPHHLSYGGHAITLIDDAYNASPTSMKAALAALQQDAEKLIILSDMLELGANSRQAHGEIVEEILALMQQTACRLIVMGEAFGHAATRLMPQKSYQHFTDADHLLAHLHNDLETIIGEAELILVKGSHGSGAHRISQYLIERGQIAPPTSSNAKIMDMPPTNTNTNTNTNTDTGGTYHVA